MWTYTISWFMGPLPAIPQLDSQPGVVDAESSWLDFEDVNWPLFRCILQDTNTEVIKKKGKIALLLPTKHQNSSKWETK